MTLPNPYMLQTLHFSAPTCQKHVVKVNCRTYLPPALEYLLRCKSRKAHPNVCRHEHTTTVCTYTYTCTHTYTHLDRDIDTPSTCMCVYIWFACSCASRRCSGLRPARLTLSGLPSFLGGRPGHAAVIQVDEHPVGEAVPFLTFRFVLQTCSEIV